MGTHKQNMQDKADRKRVTNTIGETNPNASLKENQVIEIKRKLFSGISPKELSQEFGVSYNSILKIKTGKTWLHVGV